MKTQEEIKIGIAEQWHKMNADLDMYNEYASESSCQEVYHNDINEISSFIGDADELVRAVCYGEYHYTDKYVIINVYGNLDSSNDWEEFADIDSDYYEWLIDNKASEIDIEFEDEIKDSCLYYIEQKYNISNEIELNKLADYIDSHSVSIEDDFDDIYCYFQDKLFEDDYYADDIWNEEEEENEED